MVLVILQNFPLGIYLAKWHHGRAIQGAPAWVHTQETLGMGPSILLNLDSWCLIQHYCSSLSSGRGEIPRACRHRTEKRQFPPPCVSQWMSLPNCSSTCQRDHKRSLILERRIFLSETPCTISDCPLQFWGGQEQMESKWWWGCGPTHWSTRRRQNPSSQNFGIKDFAIATVSLPVSLSRNNSWYDRAQCFFSCLMLLDIHIAHSEEDLLIFLFYRSWN